MMTSEWTPLLEANCPSAKMGLYKQYVRMGQAARNRLLGLPQEGANGNGTPIQMLISQPGKPCNGRLLVILVGIITLALGIVLSSIPWLDYLILKQLRLANGSLSYYYWQKPGVIRLTKVYIFNVTNPESFLKTGEKPRLQEVGPFVYREEMEKVNIKFHDNGTVSYQHRKILQFIPELSVDKDEKLVVPNIPLLTLSTQSNSLGYFLQKTISFVLTVGKFEPFVTLKADELVFGYDDRLVSLAHQFYPKRKRPMSKMGLLITRNGTLPEIHNLHTGYTGMGNFGLLDKLNGEDHLPYWPEKPCSDIKASEGSFFPPRDFTKSDLVHLYDKDLCRILPMKYTSSTSKHGIAVDVYTPPEETFETVANAPENKCFCPGNEYCPPKGLQNISPCQYDAPVYLSFPHFYQADPYLLTRFEGLHPRKEKHENYFKIQPKLGVPLEGKIRVQLNLKIEKAESVTPVSSFPSIIFPIMWVEEGIDDVTPAIRRWVYLATTFSDVAAPLLTYGSMFFGGCVLAFSFINAYKSFVFTKETIEVGVARLRRTSQAYIGSHAYMLNHHGSFLRDSYTLLTDTPPEDEEELKVVTAAMFVARQQNEIRLLMSAERRALTKIAEARMRKDRRLRMARDEARKDMVRFEREKEREFKDFYRQNVLSVDIKTQVDHRVAVQLAEIREEAGLYTSSVADQLIEILLDVKPELHRNFNTLFPSRAEAWITEGEMPSLRKRVTSYFRQLSFYNEPREKKGGNVNENAFVTKYLQGQIAIKEGPPIVHGKTPADLPNYDLGLYETGSETIVGCFTGPGAGLTAVRQPEKHLSVADVDIDFIDTPEETTPQGGGGDVKVEAAPASPRPVDNSTMLIRMGGQEYMVTNRHHSPKTHSLDSLPDEEMAVAVERTRRLDSVNNNQEHAPCRNQPQQAVDKPKRTQLREKRRNEEGRKSRGSIHADAPPISKSKSEGNPFQHRRRGKLVQVAARSTARGVDVKLPAQWDRSSDFVFGISDSLYDCNQVTKVKNGEPIADCFGIIARQDSAILAVADGVNWGERASVAAKSAIHGCLQYLSHTLFGDPAPFESTNGSSQSPAHRRISSTRDVFVSLLRAFRCAHELILDNEGMLTTLTVAVVLPLRPRIVRTDQEGGRGLNESTDREEGNYVCCVCNVGDTLAYIYSQRYGVREITKGSHDVSCNRDMRDALGALGPVDGSKPELSNLTLSLTTLRRGDIILVASDGLTDNFDPNVCRFTVSAKDSFKRNPATNAGPSQHSVQKQQPPQKPPRRSKKSSHVVTGAQSKARVEKEVGPGKEGEEPNARLKQEVELDKPNPLVAHFLRTNSLDETKKEPDVATNPSGGGSNTSRPPIHVHPTAVRQIPRQGFLRSKTCTDMRPKSRMILRDADGTPLVTPTQRYELCLLLMEDVLRRGLSGRDERCVQARSLCEHLVRFAFSVTAAKRHALEDVDLYFDDVNGVRVEVSQLEKKNRRRRALDKVQNLPGKLDHVTVVAYNVGYYADTTGSD